MKPLFIHGAGSSSLAFHYQLQHFPEAEAVDLPGHPHGQPCASIDAYLEWTRGFIAGRGWSDIVLGGHSMGGAIAILYALRYPEELRAIILIGTGAKLRVHPDYLQQCREPGENNADWLRCRSSAYYTGVAPEIRQAMEQRSAAIGPAVELNDLLACDRFAVMAEVPNIRIPTLVIVGAEDEMTPVKYADYLANRIPGAQKAIIPGAAHFVQLQQPQAVNAAIARFLQSL